MPIYQYRCLSCGEINELIQKMEDPPQTECPFCKGKVRRMIGPIGLVFKGSGFHVTDYARGNSSSPRVETEKKAETKPVPEKKAEDSSP